jgi:hypothetical protein
LIKIIKEPIEKIKNSIKKNDEKIKKNKNIYFFFFY